MKELLAHLEFAKILFIVSLIAILITGIVYYVFKDQEEHRLFKYIPGLIFIVIGMLILLTMGFGMPEIDEFNKVLIVVTSMVGGFVAWGTGLIIGIFTKTKEN